MTALHVFDMDGTLLRGSASRQIGAAHGSEDEVAVLERRFATRDIDVRQFAEAVHGLWQGLDAATVASAFATGAWLNGIAEVCADIRDRGEYSAVITLSPDFFAERLGAYGFDTVTASRFPALPFAQPVDPAAILTPEHKVEVVAGLLGRYGLDPARCVAYGDSMSDAPLFRYLTATVAVNADEHLAGLAVAEYRGSDIAAAYRLGRAQLD